MTVGNINQLVGFLKYHETAWDNPSVKSGIIALIVIIILLAIGVAIAIWWMKKRKQALADRETAESNKYSMYGLISIKWSPPPSVCVCALNYSYLHYFFALACDIYAILDVRFIRM